MQEKKKPSASEVNESLALGGQDVGVTGKEAFDIMKNAKDSELTELTGDYLEFKAVGEVKDLLFTGMTHVTIDGKTMDAVELMDERGAKFVYSGIVVVSACKKLTQMPCYVRLIYKEDVKSANGVYKNIRVLTFPSAKS
jgi:hypothetical protein